MASPPTVNRRHVLAASALAAGALAPLLSSCATDLTATADVPLPDLAARLGVCAVSHATLRAGRPQPSVQLSGCTPAQPPERTALFQAASLTKPLVAYVVLQLARAGQLDLRAPVSRYLPDGYAHRQRPFAGPAQQQSDLVSADTLARSPLATLLNHSAGLPNWTAGALAPQFTPGERWQYSGEGYLLLQAVVAAVAGRPFEAVVQTMAFGPLGLRDAHLRRTADIDGRVLPGFDARGQRRELRLVEANAAASLHTTADDHARLMAGWLAEPGLVAQVLAAPVPVDPALGLAWGLGWGIETADGGPCLWQWGNNPGFRAFATVSVTSGDGFVLLSNSERGMPLAAALAQATVPARHGVFRFGMLG